MSKRVFIAISLLLLLAITVVAKDPNRPLRVGVLASLTGPGSSLGQSTVAALQLAAEQLEARVPAPGGPFKVHLLVRDTKLDPNLALEAIGELDKQGVAVIIGPQSSSELAKIKPYADAHDILVISQGSTASSLSIAGDNIFRLCPNDRREAEAIVALMWRDGIRTIVPLWRNDVGNGGLHDSVQSAFQNMGGTVTAGFRYEIGPFADHTVHLTLDAARNLFQALPLLGGNRLLHLLRDLDPRHRSLTSVRHGSHQLFKAEHKRQ